MKKISIIIPVYNSEKYLEKCLKTVIEQEYEPKEVIVINDGSTDNSKEIISKYKKYIKYIEKENTGVADCRNIGIQLATGEYIMFVDSDDYIEKDLLNNLKPFIEKNIEIIKFNAIMEGTSKKRINTAIEKNYKTQIGEAIEKNYKTQIAFDTTTGEEAFSKLCFKDNLLEVPWRYLFKKELFKKQKFAVGKYLEDFGLIPQIIVSAKTFISTDIYGYHYVQTSESITRTENYEKNIKKVYDLLEHYDRIKNEIKKYKISKRCKQDMLIFYTNSIILYESTLNKQDEKRFLKEIKKRKLYKNIKIRNLKQLVKRILLFISIPLYRKIIKKKKGMI